MRNAGIGSTNFIGGGRARRGAAFAFWLCPLPPRGGCPEEIKWDTFLSPG